jgi:hypothetical protein
MPITMPVLVPTEAVVGRLLLHTPPDVGSLSVVVVPGHTVRVPLTTDGSGFTVTVEARVQPVGSVYVIVTVPGVVGAAIPVTTPVVEPTVAIVISLLSQVPPVGAPVSAIVEPIHTCIPAGVLVIDVGSGFTVTIAVLTQPVGIEYVIVAVVATDTDPPVIIPVSEPIEATAELLLLQVPPVVASATVVADPEHTESVPVIAPGSALTVITVVVGQPVA